MLTSLEYDLEFTITHIARKGIMSTIKGKLTLEELKSLIEKSEIETVLVGFTDLYGRLMGKRFDADFFVEQVSRHGTHACDYLLTVDMEMNPVKDYQFANWQRGYGDVHLLPDMGTLRIASWLNKTAIVLCEVNYQHGEYAIPHAPRSILKAQIEKAKEMHFDAMAASELEFFLFQNSYKEAAEKEYRALQPFGWYIEDYHALQGSRTEVFNAAARKHLKNSAVPVENSKGEWGIGQNELNVQYAEILEMADRHVIYKQCLKELADSMGLAVTFMAKYNEKQAGSSCHLHLSLWHKGKNAFKGKKVVGPVHCSDIFRWFLGGWIAHASEMMVFYAPTVNSFKRYQSGSWAPTRLAWSFDNRTAGFRVVGHEDSLRIECRVPGADCNPYLVFAAALASGLDGIRNKIQPPDLFVGDIYEAAELPTVPKTMEQAIAIFRASSFAKSMLSAEIHEHYVHFYETELAAYEKAVTDWELKRYFERI